MSLYQETPLTLTEAAKTAPGRPHAATIWRWYRHGVRGVRLETFVRGGRRFTTVEALERFFRQTTVVTDGSAACLSPNKSRQREIERAEAACRAAGI